MINTDFTARCMAGKALDEVAGKQDVIADLDTIRAGAEAGATAVQPATLENYQPKIDSTHKLDADLVEDTNSTNKFATQSELDQIELNKNNISINRLEIADIVDNGAKNIAIIVNASQSNMTASVQSDGYTIAITGNNQTGNKTITWGNFTVSKTGNYAVDYEITGTGGSFFIVDETTGTTVREYYSEHTSYYVESLIADHNYSIRTYRNGAIDTTISLLICNESARIISDKKVPYCPSLAELYALVKSYHSGS